MPYGPLPSSFQLTSNESVRDFVQSHEKEPNKVLAFLDKANSTKDFKLQAFIHLTLLRQYTPSPVYPMGVKKYLKTKYAHIPDVKKNESLFGPPEVAIAGVAPQWDLMCEALEKATEFYNKEEYEDLVRFILMAWNTGAGKTGIDWCMALLYKDGMPHWPIGLHGEQGYPPVLILSQSNAILRKAFLPFLQKRHPFLHPECFQVLECSQVKNNRGDWIRKKIRFIRENGFGEGIFFLAMTAQCLQQELKKYLKGGTTALTSAFACLSNVRLLLLDEVDALGTQCAKRTLKVKGKRGGKPKKDADTHNPIVGDKEKIEELITGNPKGKTHLSLVIAYLMASIRDNFPKQHWVIGLSATLAHGELKEALPNYIALAGGQAKIYKQWRKACLHSYQAAPFTNISVTIERCQMSDLTLKVHDLVMEDIIIQTENADEGEEKVALKTQLVQHCLSASFGPEVMLDKRSTFSDALKHLKDGKEWLKKLKREKKNQVSDSIDLGVRRTIEYLQKDPKYKIVIFYSRIEVADVFRKHYVHMLKEFEGTEEEKDYRDIGILSGSTQYPDTNFTVNQALDRFCDPESKTMMNRLVLMSCRCGRGQNLGMGTKVLFIGAMSETRNFIQDLGRIFRPGFTDPKEVHYIIPQKEFLGSERCLARMLANMYAQGDVSRSMWSPLGAVANELSKELKDDVDLQTIMHDYKKGKKMASNLYDEIVKAWSKRRKEQMKAHKVFDDDDDDDDKSDDETEEKRVSKKRQKREDSETNDVKDEKKVSKKRKKREDNDKSDDETEEKKLNKKRQKQEDSETNDVKDEKKVSKKRKKREDEAKQVINGKKKKKLKIMDEDEVNSNKSYKRLRKMSKGRKKNAGKKMKLIDDESAHSDPDSENDEEEEREEENYFNADDDDDEEEEPEGEDEDIYSPYYQDGEYEIRDKKRKKIEEEEQSEVSIV